MTDEYTPTTNQVAVAFTIIGDGGRNPDIEQRRSEAFQRWLTVYTVEVQADTLREAAEWARSCSGDSADLAADYIEEMADSLHPVTPETKETK